MSLLFSNNAETTLSTEIYPGDTTLTAASDGSAGKFRSPQLSGVPGGTQLATLTNPAYPGEYEVVTITARVDNVFTVRRGSEEIVITEVSPDPEGRREQGQARYWPAGTQLSARVTAGTLASVQTILSSSLVSSAPGSEKSVVLQLDTTKADPESGYSSDAASKSTAERALVFEGRSRLSQSITLAGYPVLQMENFIDSVDMQDRNSLSYPSVAGTFFVDLGAPPVWAPNTVYKRGSVIAPTVANGQQYWLSVSEIDSDSVTTDAVEPDWSNAVLSGFPVVDAHNGAEGEGTALWFPTNVPVEFEQALKYAAVVTEVGFIALNVTATTLPSVSIGVAGDITRFASAVSLNQIVGASGIHRIPIASGGAFATNLHYKVDTPATGGRFLGRFYWRGFFVEMMA